MNKYFGNEKVKYITSFGELIGVELKQEVNNANLKEEFEKEMQEQEEMDMEQLYAEVEDLERESGNGLEDFIVLTIYLSLFIILQYIGNK